MRRTTWLALPLFIVAIAPAAEKQYLYREGFIEVGSPDTTTVEQCKSAAKKVMDAWKFDLSVMQWSHPAELTKRPLLLRLLSDQRMQQDHPGARAFAFDSGDKFLVKMGLLDDPTLDLTIAHEIGHVQAFRTLGRSVAAHAVPTYFFEGHGLMLNQLYADHLGVDRHEGGGKQVRTLISLTAEQAQAILTDENYSQSGSPAEQDKKDNQMHCMGLFFIEYLRVNQGITDAVPRMARVFELVARGENYKRAFTEAYGIPLNRAIAEVVAWMKRTERQPAGRLKGMRFEEYLPNKAPNKTKSSSERE